MTQLVQLQQSLPDIEAAGYTLFAISYDPVERLAEFSNRHDVTFPLLSDSDSAVIKAFGILNTDIEPDASAAAGVHGIPYPGIYMVDENGIVTDKDFQVHHTRRLSGRSLVQRLLGISAEHHSDVPTAAEQGDELELTAYVVDPILRLEVVSAVVCRMRIAAGKHVYAHGAPQEFTPISIEVEADGIRFGEQQWPDPEEHDLTFLGTTVPVYDGQVVMSLPAAVTSDLVRTGEALSQNSVQITVHCRYQACDDDTCSLPTSVTTVVTVPIADMIRNDRRRTST